MTSKGSRTGAEPRKAGAAHLLTLKQEAFAQAYVENNGNAAAAYRTAFPGSEKWKPETLWPEASKLLNTPKVATRIDDLRRRAGERHEITVASLTEKALRVFETAMSADHGRPQASAAISALSFIGTLHGVVVTRSQSDTRLSTEPVKVSVSAATALLHELVARAESSGNAP